MAWLKWINIRLFKPRTKLPKEIPIGNVQISAARLNDFCIWNKLKLWTNFLKSDLKTDLLNLRVNFDIIIPQCCRPRLRDQAKGINTALLTMGVWQPVIYISLSMAHRDSKSPTKVTSSALH